VLLFIYALVLLITGKPFFARAKKMNVAYSLYRSTVWLRVAGGLTALLCLFGFVFPRNSGFVWYLLPLPLIFFVIGLVKSGGGYPEDAG
jgi:hypothetical protein